MRRAPIIVGVALVGLGVAAAGAVWSGVFDGVAPPAPPAPKPLSSAYPAGEPVDAARIQTGKLAFERLPDELTRSLEVHSTEIVKTAEVLATKQQRISGTCAPGSAIRVVEEDGSVVCQRLPRGVVSVAAVSGMPRVQATGTQQASVPGGVGRYQTSGEDDFLVVPVSLPDGAVITTFAYVFWDADPNVDGAAYLYRSDDTAVAAIQTREAAEEVRLASTDEITAKRVDNQAYAYFVYFQLSAAAGPNLMPIAASIGYKLP